MRLHGCFVGLTLSPSHLQTLSAAGQLSATQLRQALQREANLSTLLADVRWPALQQPVEVIAFSEEEGVRYFPHHASLQHLSHAGSCRQMSAPGRQGMVCQAPVTLCPYSSVSRMCAVVHTDTLREADRAS